jgi:hypothetical protein
MDMESKQGRESAATREYGAESRLENAASIQTQQQRIVFEYLTLQPLTGVLKRRRASAQSPTFIHHRVGCVKLHLSSTADYHSSIGAEASTRPSMLRYCSRDLPIPPVPRSGSTASLDALRAGSAGLQGRHRATGPPGQQADDAGTYGWTWRPRALEPKVGVMSRLPHAQGPRSGPGSLKSTHHGPSRDCNVKLMCRFGRSRPLTHRSFTRGPAGRSPGAPANRPRRPTVPPAAETPPTYSADAAEARGRGTARTARSIRAPAPLCGAACRGLGAHRRALG